jgi:competence protein ComEC
MIARSLMHRAPLLWLLLPWCAGSSLLHSGAVSIAPPTLAATAGGALLVAWLASRSPTGARGSFLLAAGALGLAVAAAGALRTVQDRARLADWDRLELPAREALLDLRVERLFTASEEDEAVGIARVVGTEPHLAELRGQRVYFSADWPEGGPAPLVDARFTALGVLATLPFSPPPDAFERYLADEGVNFSLSRARLEGAPAPAGAWSRFRAGAGTRLETVLRTGLEEKNPRLADLFVAMMLGRKQALGVDQKDWFVRSGTMHLFAISGLHVAAIAVAFNTLLQLVRVPSRARFVTATALLWLFVQITGAEASAMRAFWMITCLLGARQLRAPSNSLAALAASALGVLVLSPHQLFSAGFQMSYGIVAALLLYGVPLDEKWREGWRPWAWLPPGARTWRHGALEGAGRFALATLALSLAATLVSTPATLGFFGLLTPGGFFVNLVLVPVASLVLFAGVASLLAGLAGLTQLVVLFNHAAALVLAFMEWCVANALRVPGSSLPARADPAWLATAGGVAVLAALALGYALRWRRALGGYFMPYALLALLLLVGVKRS